MEARLGQEAGDAIDEFLNLAIKHEGSARGVPRGVFSTILLGSNIRSSAIWKLAAMQCG